MKKVLLITMLLVINSMRTFAQDIYLDIENHPANQTLCYGNGQNVYVNAQPNCTDYGWIVDGQFIDPPVSPIIISPAEGIHTIEYNGCNEFYHFFRVTYVNAPVTNGWTRIVWKMPGTTVQLSAIGSDSLDYYTPTWQVGPPNNHNVIYEASQPGVYPVEISSPCGSTIRTYIVYDKVEIYRATIDLETNLNKVTWPIILGQDEYIGEVKVYRDGLLVGTVPYEQGYFLDNIGSDNAARNYHLVSVTPNGEESPASAPKGTIHTTYYLDVNDNLNMTWNIPYGTQGSLTYFQICKYDSNTGDLTVVDQVNSSITDYTCGVNQFEGGYPVIAAVFNDDRNREFEDLSFSNMYTDIAIQPQEITISLEPGWTWFSYPYPVSKTLDEALVGFTPMSGDIIVSQSGGTTSFVNGRWRGALTQFTPGLGYMYYSSRSESAPLVFDLTSSRARVKP